MKTSRGLAVAATLALAACGGTRSGALRLDKAPATEAAARVAERSGRGYYFEGPTPGEVTLVAPAEATPDEVHELFRNTLAAQGYEVADSGRSSRVSRRPAPLPAAEGRGLPGGPAPSPASPADLLAAAAGRGDLEAVRQLLAAGTPPDAPGRGGANALRAAAGAGHLAVVQALAEAGASVNLRARGPFRDGPTPLGAAVRGGRREVAAYLLSQGADPEDGSLLEAAGKGPLELVQALVEGGARVNAWGETGARPLHAAAEAGRSDVVRYLLGKGAHPEGGAVRGRAGFRPTPLALAAGGSHREAVALLVAAGASADRALLSCAANPRGLCTDEMLALGARPEALDPEGAPALLVAARSGNIDALSSLLAAGGKVNARDPAGRTALHRSLAGEGSAPARTLLAAGAEVDPADAEGTTPLHLAAAAGKLDAVRLLLARGADPNRRNADGCTPLHEAARAGRAEVARVLLENGADPSLVSDVGHRPADLLRGPAREELSELLAQAKPPEGRPSPPRPPKTLVSAEAMVRAARWNNLVTLRKYLEEGGDPDVPASDGDGGMEGKTAALAVAAAGGKLEAVKLLLDAGAWPNPAMHEPFRDTDALIAAASGGHGEIARLLLAAGAEVGPLASGFDDVASALVPLCEKGDPEAVRAAVERGADVNAPGGGSRWVLPLQAAAAAGRTEIVRYLLERGADPDGRTKHTPAPALALALGAGHEAAAEPLVAGGADVRRAILGAAGLEKGALEAVRSLWKLQPAPEARDRAGRTPLLLAAQSGQRDLAAFLLEQKADLEARDAEGLTPLLAAASAGHRDLIRFLLEQKADAKARSNKGLSALHLVPRQDPELIRLVAAGGCPLDASDSEGRTPLMAAAGNRGLAENVRALLGAGAVVEAADPRGDTALHYAARAGAADTILLLTAAGADAARRNLAGKTPLEMASGDPSLRTLQKIAVVGAAPPPPPPAPPRPTATPAGASAGEREVAQKIERLRAKVGGTPGAPPRTEPPQTDPTREEFARRAQEAAARDEGARLFGGRLALHFYLDAEGRCAAPPKYCPDHTDLWPASGAMPPAVAKDHLDQLIGRLKEAFTECAGTKPKEGAAPPREVTTFVLLPNAAPGAAAPPALR